MQPFVAMQGVAAPMPKINVDTDAIIAVQHVYTLSKVGLGRYLFHRWRYADDGSEKPDFVLNRAPFRCANVLVARANFGCGSSREHAVLALADFGIRVVIAPSSASIFYENCVKNGVLPLTLQEDRVEDLLVLLEHGADRVVAVDLQKMQVKFPDGSVHAFDINDAWRETLLKGLDPVSVAASHEDQIAAYQDRDRMTRPWVWSRSPNTKKETA